MEFNTTIIINDIIKYNAILVKDIRKLANKGAYILIRSIISNWSSGLAIIFKFVKKKGINFNKIIEPLEWLEHSALILTVFRSTVEL